MMPRRVHLSDEDRFLSYVDIGDGEDPCWEWQGARNGRGYGLFTAGGRLVLAHRWAYEQWVGPIPKGMMVCHRCDRPPCIDPEHLFLGTARDNMRDMIAKGRRVAPSTENRTRGDDHWTHLAPETVSRGEDQGLAKLTEASVRAMRAEYATGSTSLKRLAAKYGVHFSTIARVVNRQTWKHID